MLKLVIGEEEFFNEENEEFVYTEGTTLFLEHSLLSIAKWEQEFAKPFLGSDSKTVRETLFYVEAMVLGNQTLPDNFTSMLSQSHLSLVNDYIDLPASATTFNDFGKKPTTKTQVITSELIYYWMVAYNIPFSCETWHLNRLLALIRICELKNSKQPKMSHRELANRNRAINEQRKAALGTTG